MDDRTKRVAMAICGRETMHRESGTECKACRNAHFEYDPITREEVHLPNVPYGCKGLGYEYLAEVAIKAADAT